MIDASLSFLNIKVKVGSRSTVPPSLVNKNAPLSLWEREQPSASQGTFGLSGKPFDLIVCLFRLIGVIKVIDRVRLFLVC